MALKAVAALAAGDMPLAGDHIPGLEALNAGADLNYLAHILMAHRKAYGYGVLGPVVPLVDMHVSAADSCLLDFDFYIVWPKLRDRHPPHPKAYLGLLLYKSPHHVIAHRTNLGF